MVGSLTGTNNLGLPMGSGIISSTSIRSFHPEKCGKCGKSWTLMLCKKEWVSSPDDVFFCWGCTRAELDRANSRIEVLENKLGDYFSPGKWRRESVANQAKTC